MMTSEIDVTNSLNKTIQTPFSLKRCKTGGSDQPLEFSTSHSTILIGIEENIFDYVPCLYACFLMTIFIKLKYFHKKTGIYTRKILFILSFISRLNFHLIWKNYVLLYIQYIHVLRFWLENLKYGYLSTCLMREKRLQNIFSCQKGC